MQVSLDVNNYNIIEAITLGLGFASWCLEVEDSNASVRGVIENNNTLTIQEIDEYIGSEYDDDNVIEEFELNQAMVQHGLEQLASEYPEHFNDLMIGNYDALTGDLLLQMCLFGEERYA